MKQQREAKRQQKLEKHRAQERARVRNQRIVVSLVVVASVTLVGIVVGSVVLTPQPASYSPGGNGNTVAGVNTFDNEAVHVETPVTYAQTPPVGGNHNPVWLNCGTYETPVPNENAVHALEHGAIWVTYDPALSPSDVESIRRLLPKTHAILSPYEGLKAPVVVSGWNVQLALTGASDERLAPFIEEYWLGSNAPEPGASCTGGVGG